jgi:hypothetical protein
MASKNRTVRGAVLFGCRVVDHQKTVGQKQKPKTKKTQTKKKVKKKKKKRPKVQIFFLE